MFEIIRHIRDDFASIDRRAAFAFVYTAVGMACIFYLRNPEYVLPIFRRAGFADFGETIAYSSANNLPALAYWVFVSMVFYTVVPIVVVKFVFRHKLREYGVNFRLEKGFWKLLALSIAIMLPLVYWMSTTAGFEARYPFLKVFNGAPYFSSTLLIWELIYLIQFVGLEFFFRGFLVHSLRPTLGLYSIFVMMVPYCMIHFGKPMPETFAAIFAGLFLGWLSFKNGNIWMGLVLHCVVAFSMDILALYNKGLLF